jgi:hypothetical protein
MLIETLRIENVDGSDYLTINRDDYDSSVHTLWDDRLDEVTEIEPETAIVLQDGLTIEQIEMMTWVEVKAYCTENGIGEKLEHETWGQFLIKSLGLE